MTDSSHPTVLREWLVAIAAVILIISLVPPADAATAERNSNSSRSGGTVSRSDVATRTSSGSTSSGSSGASSTRSGGRSGGGTATRSPRSGSSNRHHYSDNYRYNYRYNYGSHWGAYFGFFPWSYYGHYGYPYSYYPISPMLYYGPHPGDYRDQKLGALDLNVKPKKTDVWVDGQLVGPSGKFDGFPGYLWLDRGRHQLVFHRPGLATEVREVRVLRGTVVKVNLRLVEGESVAPESLVKEEYGRRRRPARRAAAPAPEVIEAERAPEAPPRQMKKVTVEPGRLLLSIEPADASVYLDGRFLGTAQELSNLHAGLLVSAGAHTLEVVRPGFGAERLELEVEANTETSLAIALESD